MIARQPPDAAWLRFAPNPLDLNGPASVPFVAAHDADVERSAIDMFMETAERFAERIACDDGVLRLSYREVAAATHRLAAAINAIAAPSLPIGILLPNDARYPVAVLACLATGRPCIMLDRNYPSSSIAAMVGDARITVVIASAVDVAAGALPAGLRTLAVESAFDGVADVPSLALAYHATDAAAFVVYTSGSTGRPKGVALSERAVLHRAFQLINSVHMNEHDIVVSLASPCTIGGLQQIFEVMLRGATLMKLDLQRTNLGSVLAAVADRRATMMYSTPAVWRAICRLDVAPAALASLRCVQSSGDVLLRADLDLMRRILMPDCDLLIVYGATEAPALLQWYVPRDCVIDGARVPSGYPLHGFDLAVVNEHGDAAGVGEIGELVARGPFTSIGIWTEGSVRLGPFLADQYKSGSRIYATGDLVRRDTNGLFVVLGRKDRQVKMHGRRIEPAEIENALRLHPDVQEAAVVAKREANVRLLAFVVPAKTAAASLAHDLTIHLRKVLPPHLMPQRVVVIESLPLLPGRKIDEEALLAAATDVASDAPIRPTAVQTRTSGAAYDRVAQAWRRTLDRRSLEQDMPFAAAGGDSLRLLELVFHLERLTGASLPLEAFHGELRPSDVASILDGLLRTDRANNQNLPTVFLLPGYAGDEPRLAQFRAGCEGTICFHTIEYPPWSMLLDSACTFDALAGEIARRIEAAQPSGPVMIAGYSVGGDLAYLVSAQLQKTGRRVSLLAILDTDAREPENAYPQMRGHDSARPGRLGRALRIAMRRDWSSLAAAMRLDERIANPLVRLALRCLAVLPFGRAAWAFHIRRTLNEATLCSLHTAWFDSHMPERLDLNTILFRSEEHSSSSEADLGWSTRCASIAVVHVHGDHRTMFDHPQRGDLCEQFILSVGSAEAGCSKSAIPAS